MYADERDFVRNVGPFVAEGVQRAEAVLVMTSPASIDLIRHAVFVLDSGG